MSKILYHYTTEHHLPHILETGFLKLTDSMLKKDDKTYKPVVWLTSQKELTNNDIGQVGAGVDKTQIRIHIKKQQNFKHWNVFSKKYRKNDKEWFDAVEKGCSAEFWWVSEEIITLDDILLIENKYDGTIYFDNR